MADELWALLRELENTSVELKGYKQGYEDGLEYARKRLKEVLTKEPQE